MDLYGATKRIAKSVVYKVVGFEPDNKTVNNIVVVGVTF